MSGFGAAFRQTQYNDQRQATEFLLLRDVLVGGVAGFESDRMSPFSIGTDRIPGIIPPGLFVLPIRPAIFVLTSVLPLLKRKAGMFCKRTLAEASLGGYAADMFIDISPAAVSGSTTFRYVLMMELSTTNRTETLYE
ncbi:hypothetical protein [Rhizobium sp. BR 315]|uniref:hypothetical protein n=1 Tax=Rhizobium sp. BR 315 TaxID=3040014 RepID=UPI003D325A37